MGEELEIAREVLTIEAEGILRLRERLGDGFVQAVELILSSPGKVVTTGVGKSGIVARKIMATLNSTGTVAMFLHPVEALHGDLGIVTPGDVVLAISNSGRTRELVDLVPGLKDHGAKVVAMTGGLDSPLARAADVVIDCGVEREACPLGMAPTASTTAALAMGDALAVVLMERRGFTPEEFRRHHPGGALGQRLAQRVEELMVSGQAMPSVRPSASVVEAARVMDRGGLGVVVVTSRGKLMGLFTDGDLRRAVVGGLELGRTRISEVMTREPVTIAPHSRAGEALEIMESRAITVLPVVDGAGRVLGVVHLHDLLGRGQVSFHPHGSRGAREGQR